MDLDLIEYNPSDTLPFCRSDSMVCQKVSDFVKTPAQFCDIIGLRVAQEPCFDGIPSLRSGQTKLEPREPDIQIEVPTKEEPKEDRIEYNSIEMIRQKREDAIKRADEKMKKVVDENIDKVVDTI